MSTRITTPSQFLDELQDNMANLVGSFYAIVLVEGEFKDTYNRAPSKALKKVVLDEGEGIATQARKLIEDCTETNKGVEERLKNVPDDGKKHATEEHLKLRVRVLVDMEAYVISLESQINGLKNEI